MGGRGAWRIGGYVADELVGYGASAQVWRGHVGRSAEPVALKVLTLADGSAVQAAKAEAALLSALDHPNLVRLRELVPDGESVVLVLELATGGSLAQLLDRRGRLSAGEVVAALSPVAAALAYAHDAGVVHCDVSPANVLFRADGSSLLADLGVARLVGGFDAPRSTLAYVDPGVAAGGVPSEASDVFMVAATALHALTGSPPWSGDTVEAVLDQAVTGEIDRLDARLSALPDALADVLRRGLDPSPIVRGSAAEFALDLRHAAPPVPVDLQVGPARPAHPGSPVSASGAAGSGRPGSGAAATDAASARAQVRSRLTSGSRPRDDSAAGIYAPVPAPASDATAAHGRRRRGAPGASAAGRAHVPRHALASGPDGAAPTPSSSRALPDSAGVVLGRPDFARPDARPTPIRSAQRASSAVPAAAAADEPPLALTHIVRSRIRPVEPPPRRGLPIAGRSGSAAAGLAVVLVALLAGGTFAWLRGGPPWPRHRAAADAGAAPLGTGVDTGAGSDQSGPTSISPSPTPTTRPASDASHPAPLPPSPRAGTGSASSGPSTSNPRAGPATSARAGPSTDAAWAAVLARLDLARQRAFAADDPAPLSAVYSDVGLLRQDRDTLRHVVAPGCQLIGLHTVYRHVHALSSTTRQVVLSTQASLTPARLLCPHRQPVDMAAHAPVAMTVMLERVGGRFLIAAIQVPA